MFADGAEKILGVRGWGALILRNAAFAHLYVRRTAGLHGPTTLGVGELTSTCITSLAGHRTMVTTQPSKRLGFLLLRRPHYPEGLLFWGMVLAVSTYIQCSAALVRDRQECLKIW